MNQSDRGPAGVLRRGLVWTATTGWLLIAGASPVRADNCEDLSDCFNGNMWPALLLILGLAALIAAAWFLGPLLARLAMSGALRGMFATAGRSRLVAWLARLLSRGSSRRMFFRGIQLQKKFKHAKDFGVMTNWNKNAAGLFRTALRSHINDPATLVIRGTYRRQAVTHFFNPTSGLNAMRNAQGQFISGWKLSRGQAMRIMVRRAIGRGS